MKFDRVKSRRIAEDLLKYEFEKGARGPDKYDCLGIIIVYFKEFGVKIPDYSGIKDWGEYDEEYIRAIPKVVRKLEPEERLKIGDIILFRNTRELTGNINHAGIFLGSNDFIHAGVKVGIRIDKLYHPTWKQHIYGYFRIRDDV